MITPPEPEVLQLLKAMEAYRRHITKFYPGVQHSPAWQQMMYCLDAALRVAQAEYQLHTEKVNAKISEE